MYINVYFPTVIKMEFKARIEMEFKARVEPDEPTLLDKLRLKIFDVFWNAMVGFSSRGIHGSPDDVILQDMRGTEIVDENELMAKIEKSNNFQVVFKGHEKKNDPRG